MTPKVSIIVPSYNHGRFLGQCLQAVIDQSFTDWEMILIDDGSKDDSVALARSFTDPRIQVHVNEVNRGTYGTQQRALDMAKGELIAVLNSDDLWAAEKLRKQVELLDAHPEAVLCYTLGWKINQDGMVDEVEDVHADWPQDELQEVLPYLMYENRILASGVLFRREHLRFEPKCRYSGDWVALLEQAYRGPVVCLRERLTFWRMHDNNTFTLSPKQLSEEVKVRERIGEFGEQWARSPDQRSAIRHGLGKNALNQFTLAIFFYDRAYAFAAIRRSFALSADKKSALKRIISLSLSMSYLRNYFWNKALLGKLDLPKEELRELLAKQPTFDFPQKF